MDIVKTGRNMGAALALMVLVILAFGGALQNGFVRFDDDAYVFENAPVAQGLTLAGTRWAFTTGTEANWHPLTWLSHMADVELHGMDPAGHHLTSLLWHIANAILLFLVLRGLTGRFWPALLAAALWAVHPLRTESVVWISERKDVLSMFFGLLAMGAHGRRTLRGRLGWTSLFFALSLMAKPTWVTLPFLLLLLDVWPLGRWPSEPWRKLAAEKGPLFLLAAVSCAVTYAVQQRGGAVQTFDWLPFGVRVGNAAVAYVQYVVALFRPLDLACFYPPFRAELTAGAIGRSLAVLLALTAAAAAHARRRPWWLIGWLWFMGTLVPMIGLVQVGAQSRADRYTLLPHVGLIVALVWGVAEIWVNLRRAHAGGRTAAGLSVLLAALLLVPVAGLVVLARRQTAVWRDSETLFRHAVAATSDNTYMLFNLANELARQERWREAGEQYRAVLAISPDNPAALNNLAWALTADPAVAPEVAQEARELSRRAVAIGGIPPAVLLNTRERTEAACGDFAAAQQTARELLGLAEANGPSDLADAIRRRLRDYAEKQAAVP
jgi:protein O-mannosyl-transferase